MRTRNLFAAATLISALAAMAPAHAQQEAAASSDDAADLAKKLQNPVAALISVPIKLDWDTGIGPAGRIDPLDEAQAKGWTIVDMKADWKRVFVFER